ncbi:hypothetical protein [Streptomyces sp. NPDC051554]|uniref:hypothetical protein n=1 Tax=Streptomyces sp. NPDC051554 TaxID=3365656 RepID=UPI0037B01383
MAYKLAGAATAACAAGGILTGDGVFRHTWETSAAGVGFLAAGVAGVLAATMRYMLARFEERTRRELSEVTERRRRLDREMQLRELELERRWRAFDRSRSTASLRMASYAYELDRNRILVGSLRQEVAGLKTEIDEVNDERNQLIANELMLTSGQFTQRAYGALKAVGGAETSPLYPSGGGRPPADVTVLYADHGREHR